MTDPFASATTLTAALRRREVGARELLELYLARIAKAQQRDQRRRHPRRGAGARPSGEKGSRSASRWWARSCRTARWSTWLRAWKPLMAGSAPRRDTDGVGAAGLVGSGAALEVLDDAVAPARSGRGRLLLVSGDAGIGKTALAAELLHRAARPGTVTVWAACSPGLGAPASWPWVQALRGVTRQVPATPSPGRSPA